MSGEDSTSGQNNNNINVVPYDYGNKKADSRKVPKFNGDLEEFSWWKTNFYNHYLHYSAFMSASTRTTVVPATMFLHIENGFEIDPS